MRVEKWREDAQPGELEDATAAEELPDSDEDGASTETGPVGDREDGGATGARSVGDRWARLGVLPAVTDEPPYGSGRNADRTVSLLGGRAGAEHGGDRAATDGPPAPRREPADAAADPAAASRGPRAGALRDGDRSARLGGWPVTTPPGDRSEAGAPGALRRERAAAPDGPGAAGDGPSPRAERQPGPIRPDRAAATGAPAALREEPSAAPQAGDRTAVPRTDALAGRSAAAPGEDPERTTMLRGPAAVKGGRPVPSAEAAAGALVRDPWQEEPAAGPVAVTHDPHEVTVQLDAVQFGADGVLRRASATPNGSRENADGPVFVDESGRRSRRYRRIGMAVGLACAGYAAVIVATLVSGNSDAPWLPVPGQQQERPAGKVETSPRPGETDATPGSGTSLLPGDSPSEGAAELPGPGASLPAPDASAGRDAPGASADPEPTATPGTRQPGTGTGAGTTPTPQASESPATTAPAVSPPPADDPAPVTSAPTGDGDAAPAADTVAAPAAPPAAAQNDGTEPAPTATSAAPSPEYVL